MNDDSNPFRRLAKAFAERHGQDTPTAPASGGSSPRTPRGRRAEQMEDDADRALFLEAVRRIKPLRRKRGGQSRNTSFSYNLAEKMKEAFDGPSGDAWGGSERGPGQTRGSGPETSVGLSGTGAAQTEPEPSFAQMLDSFERRGDGAGSVSPEEEALFAKAMQGVAPVTARGRQVVAATGRAARPQAVDPAKALRDVLEGRVEFALRHTDEYMEGFVVGVDPLVMAKLRGGQYSPEKHVDLHGMNARQAYDALVLFIKNAYQRGMRTVIVVTGRGRNSPDGMGVLRPLLQRWLCREPLKRVVLAFCTAKPGDGGLGAVYVLLRKYKKSRGKIIWDFTPGDDDFPDV